MAVPAVCISLVFDSLDRVNISINFQDVTVLALHCASREELLPRISGKNLSLLHVQQIKD